MRRRPAGAGGRPDRDAVDGPVVVRREARRRAVPQPIAVEAEDRALHPGRLLLDRAGERGEHIGETRPRGEHLEHVLLARLQRLGAPARGDVLYGPDMAGHAAVLGEDRLAAGVHPSHVAARGPHAELLLVLPLLVYRRRPPRDDGSAVGRIDGALPSIADRLRLVDAGDLCPARVDVDGATVGVGPEHADGRRSAERAKARFARLQLGRALEDGLLGLLPRHFQLRPVAGDVPHLANALQARVDQERILERHPGGVLEPSPRRGGQQTVDRLWPVHPAQEMVGGDEQSRGHEDLPVAVEGEEGEGAEDVEVRLDAPPGQVDQQRGHDHLPGRNGVAREDPARPPDREADRNERRRATEKDGRPHVDVRAARGAHPGQRRDPVGRGNGRQPLEQHKAPEQAIRPLVDPLAVRAEELPGPSRDQLVELVRHG